MCPCRRHGCPPKARTRPRCRRAPTLCQALPQHVQLRGSAPWGVPQSLCSHTHTHTNTRILGLRACARAHMHPGAKCLMPVSCLPGRQPAAAGQPPSVTGLWAEAAPGACCTSASGGTALRCPFAALTPRLRTGGWSPRARPRSLLSGAPSNTQNKFSSTGLWPHKATPQVQVQVERSVETGVVENKGLQGGAHLQGRDGWTRPRGQCRPRSCPFRPSPDRPGSGLTRAQGGWGKSGPCGASNRAGWLLRGAAVTRPTAREGAVVTAGPTCGQGSLDPWWSHPLTPGRAPASV